MACVSVSASVRQTALASQVLLPFGILWRLNGWLDSIVPARFCEVWLDFFQLTGEDEGVESGEGFSSNSHGRLEGCKQSLLSIAKIRETSFIYY